MSEPTQSEAAILNAALELPPAERAAYLDRACSGNPALRQQVEELLQAHERADDFLETPVEHELGRTMRLQLPPSEKPGDKIGRYKLLQLIGEGGCGVVYMAEQEEPVRRRVALKVIKLGMDTKQVIARFEAERQALALMDHPNIAKVLDAGATDTGRPYFVMELVRGVKITEFCDENKLSTDERLKLFIQVCQAIQHAHQKGIIHRDIKPSNILVTINDGVPVPKVIDFGIAKATQGRLTDQTLFTAFEQFIGTPAYMSPEQAVMTSLDIDTRSDIYSLGVLLYELLTGRTPFDFKELLAAGLDGMRRTIREKEPPKPSTRLSTMAADALTATAQHRHTDPPRLMHVIRGDLDWIVMKCLEKDRQRRYETANGLASDLQRHLGNEPVNARPPSNLYRLQKAVRRHKTAFATAAVMAILLISGVLVSTWQAVRATHAEREQSRLRQEANAERLKAEAERKKSDEVARFLSQMLRGAGPSVARGRDATLLREILDNTSQRINSEFSGQPEVSGDLWMTIGQTYSEIGEKDPAIRTLERAVESYRQAFTNQPAKLALALGKLGGVQSWQGRISEGKSNAWLGLEIARQLGDETLKAKSLILYARSFNSWGQGSPETVPYLREAEAIFRSQATNAEGLAGALMILSISLTNNDDAEAAIREAQALYGETANEQDSLRIANLKWTLGQQLLDNGKAAEAEGEFRIALDLWRKLYDSKHPHRPILFRFLIESLAQQDKWQAAETEIQREAEISPANDYCTTLRVALKLCSGEWDVTYTNWLANLETKINTKGVSFNAAIVLARTGRLAEYQQCSQELVNRANRQREYGRAEQASKAALLFPSAATNALACELADYAATSPDRGSFISWATMAKALAEYRRGRFAEAIDQAQLVINAGQVDLACKTTAYYIRALAQAQLRDELSARKSLAQGDESRARFRKSIILQHWNLNEYWSVRDWIFADFLRQEADRALAHKSTK